MVRKLGPGAEFDLIRRFLHDADDGLPVGPGDDAAVLDGGLVVSTDMSLEDVHFRRSWIGPDAIGYRAVAVALSDLAAMAAEPTAVLASVAFPERDVPAVAVAVMGGLRRAAEGAGAVLAGGDVTRSAGGMALDVVVLGRTSAPVLRSGAEPGMELWVTGSLGGAAAAVSAFLAGSEPTAAARALFEAPTARLREALWLTEHVPVRAMIDLSDGLVGDAGHVAAASGVEIQIGAEDVPVHRVARDGREADQALALALGGGEDYELLLAVPQGALDGVGEAFSAMFGVPLTRIGSVGAGQGVVVLDGDGTPLEVQTFHHFEEWGGAS